MYVFELGSEMVNGHSVYTIAGCSGFGPMGLSDGRIKESQLSFLSVKPDNFDFSGVGLHEQGSWSPAAGDPAMDTGQYVQVDFKGRADIRMVRTTDEWTSQLQE